MSATCWCRGARCNVSLVPAIQFALFPRTASARRAELLSAVKRVTNSRRPHARRGVSLPGSFDPFELRASPADLDALRSGLSSYAVVSQHRWTYYVWLTDSHEKLWVISVAQRDLQFKFEVFTLALEEQADFERRMRAVVAKRLADKSPMLREAELQRSILSPPPSDFRPWPFKSWSVHVLRRAEFEIADLDPHSATIGNNPIAQEAVKPGHVPPDALASCEVAAGLLFTGSDRERLLIGVDWAPENLVVTQDPAVIKNHLTSCELVSLGDYIRRIENLISHTTSRGAGPSKGCGPSLLAPFSPVSPPPPPPAPPRPLPRSRSHPRTPPPASRTGAASPART